MGYNILTQKQTHYTNIKLAINYKKSFIELINNNGAFNGAILQSNIGFICYSRYIRKLQEYAMH